MSMLKGAQNPQQMLINILQQNPQFQGLQNIISMGNGNWQQIAQSMAKQYGYNLDDLIKQLQS